MSRPPSLPSKVNVRQGMRCNCSLYFAAIIRTGFFSSRGKHIYTHAEHCSCPIKCVPQQIMRKNPAAPFSAGKYIDLVLQCASCCSARPVAVRVLLQCASCCSARPVAVRVLLQCASCCSARLVAVSKARGVGIDDHASTRGVFCPCWSCRPQICVCVVCVCWI